MSMTQSQSSQETVLNTMVDTGGELDSPTCKLFKNNIAVTRLTTKDEFVEADFPAYISQVILFSPAALDPDSVPVSLGGSFLSIAGSHADPYPAQSIYGYWLENAGGDLVGSERFEEPVQIAQEGDYVDFVPKYRFGE